MKKRTLSMLLAVICLFSLTAIMFSGCRSGKLQVSFDLNYDGAPAAPAAIKVKTGETYGELPNVTTQREGYTFAGWCLDADGEEPVTAETTVTKDTDHTLYAKWEGQEYTVSFDLQGGNINGMTTVESATVKVGNVYSMMAIPDDPKKDNHTFLGWYYDAEGTQGPVTASTMVEKTCDHTLYAKWRENQLFYDFERIEDINAFANRGNGLSFTTVSYGDSNQLMIQNPNAGKANEFLVMWAELKAGTRVTLDVTFDGELTGASQMHIFCYGANIVGDPITTGVINRDLSDMHRKWYDGNGCRAKQENGQWFCGDGGAWVEDNTVTIDFVVMEDCYGLSLWLNFGSDLEPAQWAENAIYIDNIRFTPGYKEITDADKVGGVVTPPDVDTEGEEDFPFTFECGSFSSDILDARDSQLDMSVVDYDGSKQLKVSYISTRNWLWLHKELKAGSVITFDVTFDNAGTGDGMSIFCYGSKNNGDPVTEGTASDTVPQSWFWGQGVSADFSGGTTNKQTVTFTVYEDCYGMSMMIGFGDANKTQTAIYLDNIVIQEPAEEELTAETEFPFTFEGGAFNADVLDARNSELDMSVVDYDGSKQLKVSYISTNNWLWLHKELKAGSVITFDVTFDNAGTGDGMSIFCYGSKNNGDPVTEGTSSDTVPQGWFWGQGVSADFSSGTTNKQTMTFTVYEDCYGMSMMIGFGDANKTQTAIYLDNIVIQEPAEEELTAETEFPFTFEGGAFNADVLDARNSELDMSVVDYDGSKQLKVSYISTNNWLWLHKELKAGSVITFDVTFDNAGTGDGMNIFCYGSKNNGDPVTEGTPSDTVPQGWFWGQGVNADFSSGTTNKQTVTFTVYEDCYGMSMMIGFGNENKTSTAVYFDNIVITEP